MDMLNILISIDNKYVEHAIDLLYSIHFHNEAFLNVYLIYNDLSNESLDQISDILEKNNIGKLNALKFDIEQLNLPIYINYISVETYFRLFGPLIIQDNIERLLYLDCDIICTDNIIDFYNSDFENKTIIAVDNIENEEIRGFNKWRNEDLELPIDNKYINAGVLLIDVNKYKNLYNLENILEYINNNYQILIYQDQDVLNKLFYSEIKLGDIRYNYQINYIDIGNEILNPCLVHYSQRVKPWDNKYYKDENAKYYYDFIKEKEQILDINQIDIIIPVYNSKNTLSRALSSIACQIKIPRCKIYIIDDGSSENYDDIINHFKNYLNIEYKKLDNNYGPGYAREYGMNISKSKYITFLDSDDIFSTALALNIMYSEIENSKADIVRAIEYEEKEQCVYIRRIDNVSLHGKMYRRDFIKNNNIHFNDFRSNEDTGFNALLKLYGAKYSDIEEWTYLWANNPKSLTRVDKEYNEKIDLKYFTYNMLISIERAIKDNCEEMLIKETTLDALFGIFNRLDLEKYDNKNSIVNLYIKKICDIANKYSVFDNIDYILKQYPNEIQQNFINFLVIVGINNYKIENKNVEKK